MLNADGVMYGLKSREDRLIWRLGADLEELKTELADAKGEI